MAVSLIERFCFLKWNTIENGIIIHGSDQHCTELNPAGLSHHPCVVDISKSIQLACSAKDLGR